MKMVAQLRLGTRLAVLFVVLLCAGNLAADQRDPALVPLFAQLPEVKSAQGARALEQQIWALWFASPEAGVEDLLVAARTMAQGGGLHEALDMFDKLAAAHPDFAEVWNQRAIMRFLLGDVAGSLSDIEQTLKLEPRHFGALSGRGQCYLGQERYAEALDAFEDALNINPWLDSLKRQIEMLKAHLSQQQTPI